MIKLKDIPQSNIKRFYALFGISMAGVNKADAEKQMEALINEMNA